MDTENKDLLLSRWRLKYEELYKETPGTFLERMNPEILALSIEDMEATVRFQTAPWMCNPRGSIHGGIITTMADNAMGLLMRVLDGHIYGGPTVSMNVNFIKPVRLGDVIRVHAVCSMSGRKVRFMNCRGFKEEEPKKTLFEAQAVFFVVNTRVLPDE